MEDARRAADDVLELLNKHFRARGVEFVSAAQGEGPEFADWSIALWWKEFGEMGLDAFENACEGLKTRGRPAKMCVFFKEPDEGIAEELKRFKESFATRHGPFLGRFETVDAVRFQLAAQSLVLLPGGGNGPGEREMLSVEGGEVRLEGERVAKLENLPFAKLNDRRKMLRQQIARLESEESSLAAGAAASPGDEDILRPLRDVRKMLRQLEEELTQYDGYLLNMAVSFAKTAGEELDGRVAKARELFERGKVRAANKELDLDELVESSEQNVPTFEAQRELGVKNIQALLAKAEMVMADDSLTPEERVEAACKAHEESLRLARSLRVPDRQETEMMWNYAHFLHQQKRLQASGRWYGEACERYRLLSKVDACAYLPWLAATLGRLALVHDQSGQDEEAAKDYGEALEIYRRLGAGSPGAYEPNVAATLNNLACWHYKTQRDEEAEAEYKEALEIYRRLAAGSPEAYEPYVAMTLCNWALLKRRTGDEAGAQRLAAEGLEAYKRCEELAPGAYAERVQYAQTIVDEGLMAAIQRGDWTIVPWEGEEGETKTDEPAESGENVGENGSAGDTLVGGGNLWWTLAALALGGLVLLLWFV